MARHRKSCGGSGRNCAWHAAERIGALLVRPLYALETARGRAQLFDGITLESGGNGYVARVAGDGEGGAPVGTDWQSAALDLGTLAAGQHTLTIGAYNSQKTQLNETTELLIDDVAVTGTVAGGGGGGSVTVWLHKDHLGSIQAATDGDGAAALRRGYAPYGAQLWATAATFTEAKNFVGERLDAETGLLYLHARYYDPVMGQFLSADPSDPLQPGVGVNRYAYAGGNPVAYADPYGLSYGPRDWDPNTNPNRRADFGAVDGMGRSFSDATDTELNPAERVLYDLHHRIQNFFRGMAKQYANDMVAGGREAFKDYLFSRGLSELEILGYMGELYYTTPELPFLGIPEEELPGAKYGAPALAMLGAIFTRNPRALVRNATRQYNEYLTHAGRALTKRPGVVGKTKSTLRETFNTDDMLNQKGAEIVSDMVNNGKMTQRSTGRYGDVLEFTREDGYGARFSASGEFIGFTSP